VSGDLARARWDEAIASIRDRNACPKYDGLELRPQVGLLPLGRDPGSGLWEFAHLMTGEPAERGADGSLTMQLGTGLVLVLIPGGKFWMGAQALDPSGQNFDPSAEADEAPVNEVELDPYFLSKYEMTQDQWLRFTGNNPSFFGPGVILAGNVTTPLHPVEGISWRLSTTVLQRLDLVVPTEAQWERGARGGTTSPFWTGPERASLKGAANLSDEFARTHDGPTTLEYESWLNDGYKMHSPVGIYRANAYGLHDTIGNVYEYCRDGYARYDRFVEPGCGERQCKDPGSHMIRGGAFHDSASTARVSFRIDVAPDFLEFGIGLRPARSITP
jgi:formylglycine-generating enzyme required for sulfatase activity